MCSGKYFTKKNEFILDSICIRNPEKWKKAKLPDFLLQEVDMTHHQTIKIAKQPTSSLDLTRATNTVPQASSN